MPTDNFSFEPFFEFCSSHSAIVMARKTWPTLKSCRLQKSEAKGSYGNDRLSELPLDILLLIMSYLPMKDSVRTCVLSRRWKHNWKYMCTLFFKADYYYTLTMEETWQLISDRTPGFLRWVNDVVEAHLGSSIDDLTVAFDLDVNSELTIDKCVMFALSKHVKRLELNFTPGYRCVILANCYTWPLQCRFSSLGMQRYLASLRSLCLKYVNINDEDVKCILLSCHDLESLSISSGSVCFTEIKYRHAPLQLKVLEVAHLARRPLLLCIDILAPKLVSFMYHGPPIALDIRDASLLSDVSIGTGQYHGEVVAYACASLSKYFSQLTSLNWNVIMNHQRFDAYSKWNMGIKNPPVMKNLKHLEIHVKPRCDESLFGWASLIEASPVLEKLTVKVSGSGRFYGVHNRKIVKRKMQQPLKCLKTLELVNFIGLPVEFEFATFIVRNSVCLEQVIREKSIATFKDIPIGITGCFPSLIKKFKSSLPPGIVFIYRKVDGTFERDLLDF